MDYASIQRTNTDPVITGFADTTFIAVNDEVAGTGIVAGSIVVSKTSTTVTLDQACTSTTSAGNVTVYHTHTAESSCTMTAGSPNGLIVVLRNLNNPAENKTINTPSAIGAAPR